MFLRNCRLDFSLVLQIGKKKKAIVQRIRWPLPAANSFITVSAIDGCARAVGFVGSCCWQFETVGCSLRI